ncbi:hypothetical protein TCSYLVIO_003392 [Trypanosoma cruzi]|nr:hypothetical protein TCSYLVIO_003392 [Trypanosoma cruzi]
MGVAKKTKLGNELPRASNSYASSFFFFASAFVQTLFCCVLLNYIFFFPLLGAQGASFLEQVGLYAESEMATSQLIAMRYMDLLSEGNVENALVYLSDDAVYNTWMGVVYGKENVAVFLRDNVRFVHHGRNYNRWRQVQHSLDPSLRQYDRADGSGSGSGIPSRALLQYGGDQAVRRYFNAEGYDSQGYATFERDGTIASRAKFSAFNVKVKETVVLRNNKVVLVNVSKRV